MIDISPGALDDVRGGLEWSVRLRAFNAANRLLVRFLKNAGPGAENLPEALRLERVMKATGS